MRVRRRPLFSMRSILSVLRVALLCGLSRGEFSIHLCRSWVVWISDLGCLSPALSACP